MAVFPYLFATFTTEQLLLQFASLLSKIQPQSSSTSSTLAETEESFEFLRAKEAFENGTVLKLVNEYASQAAVLLCIPETQMEGQFALLLALIQNVSNDNAKDEIMLIQAVLQSLQQSTHERGTMKLRLVHHIFNALPTDSPLRRRAFDALSKIAHRHGELKALGTQLPHLPTWIHEWKMHEKDFIPFFNHLSQLFLAARLHKEAYECLLLLLPLITHQPKEFESLFNQAVCIGFRPSSELLDLSGLLPLSSHLRHSIPSLSLLHPYLTGDVLTFRNELPTLDTISKVPIDPDFALDKVRLVHLSRLPSGLMLSYTSISQSLVCPLSEVENYVIGAIEKGLLVAKLNPIDQTMTVRQPRPHHFERTDWKFLQDSLILWQTKLNKAKTKVLTIGQESFHAHDDSDEEENEEEEEDEEDIIQASHGGVPEAIEI